MDEGIICFSELDATAKQEAVEVFLDGFGHMFTFAKTRAELVRLFSTSFEELLAYVYMVENHVGGVLGLGTNTQRAMRFDRKVCEQLFGKSKGEMIYNMLHKSAEIPTVKGDADLYIDYLATGEQMRNRGIATKLLAFACQLLSYEQCCIEVLSKNTTAAKLYQKLGFVAYKKKFNLFTFMQGLGHRVMMKKPIRQG